MHKTETLKTNKTIKNELFHRMYLILFTFLNSYHYQLTVLVNNYNFIIFKDIIYKKNIFNF